LNKHGSQSSVDKYSYDGLGRLVTHTYNSGHEKRFTYDAHDRVTQTISPDNHVTDVEYAAHSVADVSSSISIDKHDPFASQDFDGIDRLVKEKVGGDTERRHTAFHL
jgi:YD repeat-containing protein